MTKVKILQTTMVAGQRHAKGDEVNIDESTAQNLVALGKAEIVPDKKGKEEQPASLESSAKAMRRE